MGELNTVSHKLAEELYKAQGAGDDATAAGAGDSGAAGGGATGSPGTADATSEAEDVEYEVVDEE
jgi:hypothetical protein